jgi:hypothetical protein
MTYNICLFCRWRGYIQDRAGLLICSRQHGWRKPSDTCGDHERAEKYCQGNSHTGVR